MSQPPYGPYGPPHPSSSDPPPPQQGLSPLVGYLVGGLVLGPVIGVVCPIMALFLVGAFDSQGVIHGAVYFVAAVALPLLVPVPFLFSPATRPWGVGMLIGAAIVAILLAGSCALIIQSFNNGYAGAPPF